MHALTPLIVLGLCAVSLSASTGFVERVNEIKAFKKFMRTRTNVLVLFRKTEKSTKKLVAEYVKAAEAVKGIATVLSVDCSGDGTKLCKKLKVVPDPLTVQHYKDGEFNKEYDRSPVLKSIVNFLRDPTGDIPWDEEPLARDVVHITSVREFDKVISHSRDPLLVMFYAPWCGHCKRLKPEFAQAAMELKGEKVLVGVDVDKPEMSPLRQAFNITGFPTLVYFEEGKLKYPYGGGMDKEGIKTWLAEPSEPKAPEPEVTWSEMENDVVHLTDDTFNEVISTNPSVLVMFYAPWCGHCKKMKPDYESVASKLKAEKIDGVLAAVDATQYPDIASKYDVSGYPKVWYFKSGEAAWVLNERTEDKILSFMRNPEEPPAPPPPEAPWSDTESSVSHLTSEDFAAALKKKKHVLVMFYAPWCGHCKKAKPHFTEAANKFADNTKVMFAAVDCTEHQEVCGKYDVKGYPTLKYFSYGKNPKNYEGNREEADFIRFMENPENPRPAPPPAVAMWEGVPGGDNVEKLTNQNFEQFIRSNPSVLVMFYAPWCGHCKTMKADFAAAALELSLQNANGVLAAVDCTTESEVAEKYGIKGFPTVKYFKTGSYAFDFNKRTKEAIMEFILKPVEPEPPKAEDMWEGVDGSDQVHHLTDESFDAFVKENPSTLVMFYAPWCGHCKKMKPAYAEAAKEAAAAGLTGRFAAVDCTLHSLLQSRFDVKGFPTLKYFESGKDVLKYTGARDSQSLLDFIKNPQTDKPEKKDEL